MKYCYISAGLFSCLTVNTCLLQLLVYFSSECWKGSKIRMERWCGRVALVTGASAGIGKAICRELMKQSMVVIGCARNIQPIEDIAKEPEMAECIGKLHAIKCDVSREEDILAMFEEIRQQFGRIDVCINNAMSTTDSALTSGETNDWRYLLDVGVLGLCICTRETVKLMKTSGIDDGQIIHIGSVVGHKLPSFQKPPENTPTPWFHMYNGIKTMIRVLAEGLRQELKAMNSHIRVAMISPGIVETEMLARSLGKPVADAMFSTYKCLQPKDVADIVTYVLKAPPHANINDVIVEALDFMIQA